MLCLQLSAYERAWQVGWAAGRLAAVCITAHCQEKQQVTLFF